MNSDYLGSTIVIGLCEWLGCESFDLMYPPFFLFNNSSWQRPHYGKGYSYANVLGPLKRNDNLSDPERRLIMVERLKNKSYDLVIYGQFPSSRELFADYALPLYSSTPERLWLFDGRDKFDGWPFQLRFNTLRYKTTIFIRELF